MKEWQTVKQAEANWTLDRPTIQEHNTLDKVAQMLQKEVVELMVAMGWYGVDPTDERRKEVLQEASDVGLFLMALFRLLEADMLDEVMEKQVYNSLRYPSAQFQEGDYKETYQRLKKRQSEIRKEFYAPLPEPTKQE